MAEKDKFVVQVYDSTSKDKVERLWVTSNISYHQFGIICYERDKPETELFIPYSSVRMISKPKTK